jgi:hypothetical protein
MAGRCSASHAAVRQVPLAQSKMFAARAAAVGARPVDLVVRAGKGHGWPEMAEADLDGGGKVIFMPPCLFRMENHQ